MHLFLRAGVVAALLSVLVMIRGPAPSTAQVSLDDAVVRAFEITATLRPEPFAGVCDAFGCRVTRFGALQARTLARIEVTGGSPVSSLRLFMDQTLTVRAVTGVPLTFRREGDYLLLAFDPPLVPRSTTTLAFAYDGRPASVWDDLILVDEGVLYPVIVSPFGDVSANRALIKAAVTVPSGYALASTGRASRQDGAGTQTYRWEVLEPLPYIGVAGGRGFQVVERTAGTLPMSFYVRPRFDRFLGQITDVVQRTAEVYARILYPLPHEHVAVVAAPFGRGLLGLGYPSLMLLSEDVFTGGPGGPSRDSFRFLVVAHELAHTYFPAQTSGKGVATIWLSEGFAEYLGLMSVESVLGRDAFRRELAEHRRLYTEVAGRDRAIAAYTRVNRGTPDELRVRYSKGPYVLHMLRHVVGTETFIRILSAYATRFRGQSVRVQDFAQTASEVAGRDLAWFFDQWIMQRLLPDYVIAEAASAPAEGGIRTTAQVRNLGTGEMPVDVLFELDNGERIVRRVEVGSRGAAAVAITASRPARRVEADPDKWILQTNYGNDVFVLR